MNKRQKRILEDNFNIYKDNNNWDLETWTNGGVDMFITINPSNNVITELEEYVENFDIDEEIEIYRQDEKYREAFTIRESLNDFENWIIRIKDIIRQLKENE